MGLTVILAVVDKPEPQSYDWAPEAVKVVGVPLQTVVLPVIAIVGNGLTCTVNVSVFLHPLLSVPITEYVVFEVGLTVIKVVVLPVFHIYELAPDIDNVVGCP